MPKDNFFSAKYSPTLWSGKYVSGNHKTQFWIEFFYWKQKIRYISLHVFCYIHFTDGLCVLYGWASVFPIIGSISLTTFLTATFFSAKKLTLTWFSIKHPKLPPEIFGLFQSLIECIYRHLILDIGPWTNLNIKETPKLRWKQVNICSAPFTINIS